jgi:hypothetical protein
VTLFPPANPKYMRGRAKQSRNPGAALRTDKENVEATAMHITIEDPDNGNMILVKRNMELSSAL